MLNSLQAGRAFAALAVVVFHLSPMFGKKEYGGIAFWEGYTSLGYLGVDFFFALSGFIILAAHYSDLGRPGRLGVYLVKRFIRIYPLYWLITGIVIGGAWLTSGAVTLPSGLTDVASMMSLVHLNAYRTPVLPAWTLFHEVFFYALMGLAIWNRLYGVVALVAWALLLLIVNVMLPDMQQHAGAFLRMVMFPGNLAFFGGLGAYLIYRVAGKKQAAIWSLSGFSVFLVLLTTFDSPDNVFLFKACLALAFAGIIGGVAALEKNGYVLDMRILTEIGNASFMLYLTHGNIQTWSMKFFHRLFPAFASQHRMLVYLAVVAACLLFSLAAHRWVEKPLLRYLRNRLLPRPGGPRQPVDQTLPA